MVEIVRDTIQPRYKVTYDTSYTIIHKQVKQPEPFTFINHYMGDTSMYIYRNEWGDVLYLDENLTKFEPKVEVEVEPVAIYTPRASDSIQPCDVKWLIKGEKLNLKPIISHKNEIVMAQEYIYSDLSNSIVMMLMLLATSVWLYRSIFDWAEMISKINKIVRA